MISNHTKDLYNNAYKKFTPDYIHPSNLENIDKYLAENCDSLVKFFDGFSQQFDLQQKFRLNSCLELGCGLGSFSYHLRNKFSELISIDYSDLAIMNAKSISRLKGQDLDFRVTDVCKSSLASGELGEKQFDVIVDSHLFHCLTDPTHRERYLSFIKKRLAHDGIFLLESMVFQKNIQVPVGYYLDENYILSIEDTPFRSILPSKKIEEEFATAGLQINYLYYHDELSFNPYEHYNGHPVDFLPKTLRLSATVKNG